MAQIKVRDLDDWIVNVLRDHALSSGNSLEQHLRDVLKNAALANQKSFAAQQLEHLAAFKQKHGIIADSTPDIRQDREQHG
ncbi:MAG: hypothetical protein R3E01_36310 [Pirellulaceae bacterium]